MLTWNELQVDHKSPGFVILKLCLVCSWALAIFCASKFHKQTSHYSSLVKQYSSSKIVLIFQDYYSFFLIQYNLIIVHLSLHYSTVEWNLSSYKSLTLAFIIYTAIFWKRPSCLICSSFRYEKRTYSFNSLRVDVLWLCTNCNMQTWRHLICSFTRNKNSFSTITKRWILHLNNPEKSLYAIHIVSSYYLSFSSSKSKLNICHNLWYVNFLKDENLTFIDMLAFHS